MANVPMVAGESYIDFQNTQYFVETNNGELGQVGALKISIQWRKFSILFGDEARMNNGHFQMKLAGTQIWYEFQWMPMRFFAAPA